MSQQTRGERGRTSHSTHGAKARRELVNVAVTILICCCLPRHDLNPASWGLKAMLHAAYCVWGGEVEVSGSCVLAKLLVVLGIVVEMRGRVAARLTPPSCRQGSHRHENKQHGHGQIPHCS